MSGREKVTMFAAMLVFSTTCFALPAVLAGEASADAQAVVPPAGQVLVIEGRCQAVGHGLDIRFGTAARGPRLTLRAGDMASANHHWQLTKAPEAELPDACLRLDLRAAGVLERPVSRLYFIRPDVHFYLPDDPSYRRAVADWATYPAASQHRFRLEIARRGGRYELAIDGRFLTGFPERSDLEKLSIAPSAQTEIAPPRTAADTETDRFVAVDLSSHPHQGDARVTEVSVGSGRQQVGPVPMSVAPGERAVDVGLSRWLRRSEDGGEFYDPDYRRSAWDGVPESILFSVPRRHYTKAHLLCAVRTDGEREPTLTVRLARYRAAWDGGGGAQADTTVRIHPENTLGGCTTRRVGTATVTAAGQARQSPLYLVEVPLSTGELADALVSDGWDTNEPWDHFDLELSREMRLRRKLNHGVHQMKPLGPASGVLVLGLTLEKSPVRVWIKSSEHGYVFHQQPRPSQRIEADNPADQPQILTLTVRTTDFFGQEQAVQQRLVSAPGRSERAFDLGRYEPGWYRADFDFADAEGRPVWRQPIRFAVLPPDKRQAGAESPFGIWWFKGNHYTQQDPEAGLALIRKLGFRHTTSDLQPRHGQTPELFRKHGVTPHMLPYLRQQPDDAKFAEQVRAFVRDWPEVDWAMVFHETSLPGLGLDLPAELLDQPPPPLDPEQRQKLDALRQQAVDYVRSVRQVKPDMKIMLGNGGTPFNVQWLRDKFPRDQFDALGMEMAVQKFYPEGQPNGWNLQSLWIAKRMRELCGYQDLPVTSCYEFDYRPTADGALTLRRQADWYARDVLHCLAYRLPHINVALLDDCNSAYYFSRWGSAGVCTRAPLNMPKPSFVALATLTQVLDRAEYLRWLDLGTTGAYCLEFRRPDNLLAYALWTVAGRRKIHFQFPVKSPGASATVVDVMGRARVLGGDEPLWIDESPLYYLTRIPPQSATAGEAVHAEPPLEDVAVIDPLSDPVRWRLVTGRDEALENWCAYQPLAPAKATVGAASEGRGLSVTLQPQPELPALVGTYAVLEPVRGPIPIAGRPTVLAVRVRGNACFGRVLFEIIDAQNRRWTSIGFGDAPRDWNLSDWEGDTGIHFDGEKQILLPLPDDYPAADHYGPNFFQWRCQDSPSPTNRLAYPLRFSRLILILRQQFVYLTDLVPARSHAVQLRGLAAGSLRAEQ